MNNLKKLPILIKQCMTLGTIPTSYKVSLSYEEQLLWFCNFLENEVIPVVNNNSEVVEELKNYLENLDVQEEINNKLDEMAESGELTEIIAQYLQLAGILAFNTVSSLSNAENLIAGSFAKTYGKLTYNDGLGAFYKIRTLINTDIIDGDNLVALINYPTLVAEKIPNNFIGNLENLNTTNKNNVVSAINEVNTKVNEINTSPLLKNKKIIVMGDSLCITGRWGSYFIQYSGANGDLVASGSAGFCSKGVTSPYENMNFLEMLQYYASQKTTSEKNAIEYLILGGGINDALNSYTVSQIKTNVEAFILYAKTTFPNAKLIIFPLHTFKWLTNTELSRYQTILDTINNSGIMTTGDFIFWTVDDRTYSDDNVHLTTDGYKLLANKILSFVNGSNNIEIESLGFSLGENFTNINFSASKVGNIVYVHGQIRYNGGTLPNASDTTILSFDKGAFITGSSNFNFFIPVLLYASGHEAFTNVNIINGEMQIGRPINFSTFSNPFIYINGSFPIGISGIS